MRAGLWEKASAWGVGWLPSKSQGKDISGLEGFMHNTTGIWGPMGGPGAKAGTGEREQAPVPDEPGPESQRRSPFLQCELGPAACPFWPSSSSSEKWCLWWSPCYIIETISNTHATVKPLHPAPSEHHVLVIRSGGQWAWQASWGQTAKRAL